MNPTPNRRAAGNRLLGSGYAQVLRVFVDGPASWHGVAEKCGTNRVTSQKLCHGLRKQRLIYIASWVSIKTGRRSQWTPVYACGDKPDAEPPMTLRCAQAPRTAPELLAFCDLIRAMQVDSWHSKGLAAHLGHCERTVRKTVKALHALRLVYIDDYMRRPQSGAGYPLFTWGPDEQDAKKPAPRSARSVWTSNNRVQAARRQQMHLLHGMVRGVSLDGRRKAANREDAEAVA
ncbi:MAG: hypothetical protein RL227_1409 [Pseudomonadota bacterium]